MQKKENTYWFCGSKKTTDDKVKHDLVKMVIDGMNLNGWGWMQALTDMEEILMNMDLTHTKEEGVYYVSVMGRECRFVPASGVASLVKETATEINSDMDTQSDVTNEIEYLTGCIDKIDEQIREINVKLSGLREARSKSEIKIDCLRMKLRHLDNPEPKCKVGDYVIAKSPYSGQECVYRVASVYVDKRLWKWVHNVVSVTTNEPIILFSERIVRFISAPKQQVGDTVESTVISGKVKSISYDKARDLWKYKVNGEKGASKMTAWVYETELK